MIARVLILGLVVAATALSGSLQAQSDQGMESRVFGQGQPATVDDLPPGQLKRKIIELPPQARGRALKWLQDFSFPEADVTTLDVDSEGGIYYVDSTTIEAGEEAAGAEQPGAEAAPQSTLDDAFLLHSKPGASNTVFVDFDGDTFSNTAWGSGTFYARPYDIDGDPTTFNDTERRKIVDIWHRIAEDMAPFDIDVTTEEPASFDRYTGHVLVTHSQQENGADMPYPSAGGVAYVNVFGVSNYHSYYSPALVYFNNLGNGFEHYVAEASTHEFGHNLGMSHDGTTTGDTYYSGHGSNLVSWAPIMGVGYYKNVTQWSKGEYANANQFQDDLAIIDGKLGYDSDDHGDSLATASALDVATDGGVVSSNPEFDPHNLLPENKGLIGDSSDVDVFSFLAGTGTVNLTVTPAWDAFTRSDKRGANLDVRAELRDSGNGLVASSDPIDDTMATISASVTEGAYYLLISGVGNTATPYTDYDSMGQYFINGSVPPATPDGTAPTPDPMAFETPPAADGQDSISMTAVVATDNLSAVQYQFRCTAGGTGCSNSAWQAARNYTASGLEAATQYTFTVVARDQSANETAPSAPASATTDAPPPYVDHTSSGETPVAGSVSGTHSATHADDGSTETIMERESGGKPSNRHTYLEHRWNFTIGSGASATVFANAWRSGSNSSESFDIEYSTNGGSTFAYLMNVSSTSSDNLQSAEIPGAPSGSVILRVRDTHQQSGDRNKSTFHVDHLYIQVGNPPSGPPAAPTGMSAIAVSSSAIDLSWMDASVNESGFTLQRSPDGSSDWVGIADLGVGMESHGDNGLDSATQYFYRLRAWNGDGVSDWVYANATTDPESAISLEASGYKSKGRHGVVLNWTGADPVDIYFNGNLHEPNVSGSSYDHFIGNKGGASYTHKVCEAGTSNCSNTTTTVF